MTSNNSIRNGGDPRAVLWKDDAALVNAAMRYWPVRFGTDGSEEQLRRLRRAEAEAMWPRLRETVLIASHEEQLRRIAESTLPEETKQRYTADAIERLPQSEAELHAWSLDQFERDPSSELAARWAHDGYRKMVTSHKYGAALMCTSVEAVEGADLEVAGRTILFVIPDGLLAATQSIPSGVGPEGTRAIAAGGHDLPYTRALLDVRPGRVLLRIYDGSHGCVVQRVVADLEELARTSEAVIDADPSEARVAQLACRLVLGLLLTMQHTAHFRTEGYPFKERDYPHRFGPPPHRVVFVGKPMTLDLRDEVRSYVGGHRIGPPAVQTLVRGHYRRQVIGIGRAGRKVIWIEPYWRGPEDAPILARPIAVPGPSTER